MNRRKFLQMLSAGAIITAAGLELPQLSRSYFLPPPGGWGVDVRFSNQLLSIEDFERRILQPAIDAIAKRLDADIAAGAFGAFGAFGGGWQRRDVLVIREPVLHVEMAA